MTTTDPVPLCGLAIRALNEPPAQWVIDDDMTIEFEALGWLTIHALVSHIYADEQDEGCCPECCGPCTAVAALMMTGRLDDIVRPHADGYDWWDVDNDRVDRERLYRAWRMTSCHKGQSK